MCKGKPMNKYLQLYLISLWSCKYGFIEDIDIDSDLRLPENWYPIKEKLNNIGNLLENGGLYGIC